MQTQAQACANSKITCNNDGIGDNNSKVNFNTSIPTALQPTVQSFQHMSGPFSQNQAYICSTPPTPTDVQVNQLSLAEMESIISPFSRHRSESFAQQEVELLISEIGKRRHILLSKDPAQRGMKKKAWEEVAASISLKCPHEPRRTGIQV